MSRPKLHPKLERFRDMDKFMLVNEILLLQEENQRIYAELHKYQSGEGETAEPETTKP